MAILIDAWSSELRGKNVGVFTDNQAAQASFVECFTENSVAVGVVVSSCQLEEELEISCWYERVNTASNVADEPSRGEEFCFKPEGKAQLRSWEEYVSRCGISLA